METVYFVRTQRRLHDLIFDGSVRSVSPVSIDQYQSMHRVDDACVTSNESCQIVSCAPVAAQHGKPSFSWSFY